MTQPQKQYWDEIADDYQSLTSIATDDFHFGPLLPGDRTLGILPEITTQTRCLELGSGAAQNSIYLASKGAACTAIDISSEQIRHAAHLSRQHDLAVNLHCASLDEPATWPGGTFDLVHSVYALPFLSEPEAFIREAAKRVTPGGTFLLVTQHPVFTAEWLELEDEEMGLFLPSYFDLADDLRQTQDDQIIGSSSYPISAVSKWIHNSGLRDLRLWEPEPVAEKALKTAPYHSPAWIELYPKLAHSPVAIIFSAVAPQ